MKMYKVELRRTVRRAHDLFTRSALALLVLCGIAWAGDRWGSPDGSRLCVPSGLSDALCMYFWTTLEVLPSGAVVVDHRWFGVWHQNTRTGALQRVASGRLPIWPLASLTAIF